MHWQLHFDGRPVIKNETTKLSRQNYSCEHVQQNPDSCSSITDSSIQKPDDTTPKKERFFNRKSARPKNKMCKANVTTRANDNVDQNIKAKLFHIHVPWKNRKHSSFGSLSSFEFSDIETHLEKDHHADSDPHTECEDHQTSTKTVSFSTIQIREYDLVLGDHPYCSNGVPTCLGWHHIELKADDLDHYECGRGARKSSSQFRISATARKDLLTNSENDYTQADFRRAERKVYKDRSKKNTQRFFNMS